MRHHHQLDTKRTQLHADIAHSERKLDVLFARRWRQTVTEFLTSCAKLSWAQLPFNANRKSENRSRTETARALHLEDHARRTLNPPNATRGSKPKNERSSKEKKGTKKSKHYLGLLQEKTKTNGDSKLQRGRSEREQEQRVPLSRPYFLSQDFLPTLSSRRQDKTHSERR